MERICYRLSLGIAGVLFGYVGAYYETLPDNIAIHFGVSGQADGFGGKAFLWLLPTLYLMTLIFLGAARKRPNLINLPFKVSPENHPRALLLSLEFLGLLAVQIGILFTYLTWEMIRSAENPAQASLGIWFLPALVIALLGPSLSYLWRLRKLKAN